MASTANARFEARLPQDVHALIKRAAELEGRSLSDFVISAAKVAAQQSIRDAEVLQLSLSDQLIFANALINPIEPNEALQKAFKNHQMLLGE